MNPRKLYLDIHTIFMNVFIYNINRNILVQHTQKMFLSLTFMLHCFRPNTAILDNRILMGLKEDSDAS